MLENWARGLIAFGLRNNAHTMEDVMSEGRLAKYEKSAIHVTLFETEGNVAMSARILGCTANGLRKKLERHEISLGDYRLPSMKEPDTKKCIECGGALDHPSKENSNRCAYCVQG